MKLLQNKRALIVGLLSNRSIAYGIAEAFHAQGAEMAFTYVDDRFKTRVTDLAAPFGNQIILPCDLAKDEDITEVFEHLKKSWDHVDIIVHSAAFAPADQLEGDYIDHVTREGFRIAHDISSYSFAAIAKAAKPMLSPRAALLTLTYQGAERAVVNYNVMGLAKASLEANVRYMAQSLGPLGVRVNAISAGPIRTLAAAGIKDFRKMLDFHEKVAPLKKNVTIEEVGNAAAFLCSDLASGITAEILHVDSGFHAVSVSEI